MTKLYKEIEIKNKSRYVNTKASESYIDVTFKYNDTQWDGWVPVIVVQLSRQKSKTFIMN